MSTLAPTVHIGPADNGRAMTLEEFIEAEVEEGYRYELARGVLEVSNVPNDPHGQVVSNLYASVASYRQTHTGVVLRFGGGAEFQFLLPRMVSGRHPDLAVVLRGAPRDWRGRTLPVLAAEIVSKSSIKRDSETKREDYLAYGLLEYWIVEPLKRHVTVLTRRGDAWHEAVLRDQQVITSLVLPGFATTVAELWTDVEDDEDSVAEGAAANGS